MVDNISDDRDRSRRVEALKDATLTMDHWAEQFSAASGESRSGVGRFRHSSSLLFDSIRTSSLVRGGASNLKTVVQRAIALVSPEALAGTLCKGIQPPESEQHFATSILPSVSAIARGELSLDISLSLYRRRLYKRGVFRYLWTDSSPIAGFDWLWGQCHEIAQDDIVSVCKSAHELTRCTTAFAERLSREAREPPMDPLPDWKPLLNQLLKIGEHIFPPVSLALGRTSLSHKVSALAHQWAMELPEGSSLSDFGSSFVSHTSDMGVEISIPDFVLDDVEGLLGPVINRAPLQVDVERDAPEGNPPAGGPAAAATDPQERVGVWWTSYFKLS